MNKYIITVAPEADQYLARVSVQVPDPYEWREGPNHKMVAVALGSSETTAIRNVVSQWLGHL